MKLRVSFTVDVEFIEDQPTGEDLTHIEHAVEQAISNAIAYAEGEGHSHFMDDEISIIMEDDMKAEFISEEG